MPVKNEPHLPKFVLDEIRQQNEDDARKKFKSKLNVVDERDEIESDMLKQLEMDKKLLIKYEDVSGHVARYSEVAEKYGLNKDISK